jgi:glutamate-ammonia-ligase adenylyltransferase
MLVSNLRAFADYQRNKAWVWEHQALVRARVVVGDRRVAAHFDSIRREVLGRRRDLDALRREVTAMRERMREANCTSKSGEFDLKQDRGAIADIEFMVQYGVLAWATNHPALLDYTDNIRLLAGFAQAGLMPEEDTALLSEAYRTFRNRLHRLTLQAAPGIVAREEYADLADRVMALWDKWMLDGTA